MPCSFGCTGSQQFGQDSKCIFSLTAKYEFGDYGLGFIDVVHTRMVRMIDKY